jgi:hypothetical protein
MRSSSALGRSLIVALAAHAAVAAWAWHAHAPRTIAAESEARDADEAAIEVSEAPVEPPALPVTEPETVAEARPATTTPTARAVARGPDAESSEATVPPGAASSEPAPAEASSGTWTFSPTAPGSGATTPGSTGLAGGGLAAATQAGIGQTVAEAERKRREYESKHQLRQFTEHDMALGLVPGGVLVSIAHDIVRRSLVPTTSRALLQFDTDGAGIVSSFHVLEASSGMGDWNDVAAQMAAAAHQRPMHVPSGAHGVSVTLEVSSAMKTVDGVEVKGKPSPIAKALGAVMDPAGAAMSASTPPQHVIAARIVDVKAF